MIERSITVGRMIRCQNCASEDIDVDLTESKDNLTGDKMIESPSEFVVSVECDQCGEGDWVDVSRRTFFDKMALAFFGSNPKGSSDSVGESAADSPNFQSDSQ